MTKIYLTGLPCVCGKTLCYETEIEAEDYIKSQVSYDRKRRRAYFCEEGKTYHITTRVKKFK